jgi:hypothetical protein
MTILDLFNQEKKTQKLKVAQLLQSKIGQDVKIEQVSTGKVWMCKVTNADNFTFAINGRTQYFQDLEIELSANNTITSFAQPDYSMYTNPYKIPSLIYSFY